MVKRGVVWDDLQGRALRSTIRREMWKLKERKNRWERKKRRVSITSAEIPEESFKIGVLRW